MCTEDECLSLDCERYYNKFHFNYRIMNDGFCVSAAHTLPESVVRRLKAISDMYNSGDESSDNEDGTDRRDKRMDPGLYLLLTFTCVLGLDNQIAYLELFHSNY